MAGRYEIGGGVVRPVEVDVVNLEPVPPNELTSTPVARVNTGADLVVEHGPVLEHIPAAIR